VQLSQAHGLSTRRLFGGSPPSPPPPPRHTGGCAKASERKCVERGGVDGDCCSVVAVAGCAAGYHQDTAAWGSNGGPGCSMWSSAKHTCCKKDDPGAAPRPAGVTDTTCNNIEGNTNCRICARASSCAWCHDTGNGEPACQNLNNDNGGTCKATRGRVCTGCNAPGVSCKQKPHSHCVTSGVSHACACDNDKKWYEVTAGICSQTHQAAVTCADASADQQHTHLQGSTCAKWKTGGYCTTRETASTAKAYCLKSCGYCGGSR